MTIHSSSFDTRFAQTAAPAASGRDAGVEGGSFAQWYDWLRSQTEARFGGDDGGHGEACGVSGGTRGSGTGGSKGNEASGSGGAAPAANDHVILDLSDVGPCVLNIQPHDDDPNAYRGSVDFLDDHDRVYHTYRFDRADEIIMPAHAGSVGEDHGEDKGPGRPPIRFDDLRGHPHGDEEWFDCVF